MDVLAVDEVLEVVKITPQERVLEAQSDDLLVPQDVKEILEVEIPTLQDVEELVSKVFSQNRFQQRLVEQMIEVPRFRAKTNFAADQGSVSRFSRAADDGAVGRSAGDGVSRQNPATGQSPRFFSGQCSTMLC